MRIYRIIYLVSIYVFKTLVVIIRLYSILFHDNHLKYLHTFIKLMYCYYVFDIIIT